jgi:hypothetical protein
MKSTGASVSESLPFLILRPRALTCRPQRLVQESEEIRHKRVITASQASA